jgi:hypothetical protein
MFSNNGNLKFNKVAGEWGLDEPSFSNGAAYGDIDDDGDLDLVVNNVNQELFVYKNQSSEFKTNNFLTATFKGPAGNYFGIGASIKVFLKDQIVYTENMPMRGFQSGMDYKMVIGLGNHKPLTYLCYWPDSKVDSKSVKANQGLIFDYATAGELNLKYKTGSPYCKSH